jgi:hypothetical protein
MSCTHDKLTGAGRGVWAMGTTRSSPHQGPGSRHAGSLHPATLTSGTRRWSTFHSNCSLTRHRRYGDARTSSTRAAPAIPGAAAHRFWILLHEMHLRLLSESHTAACTTVARGRAAVSSRTAAAAASTNRPLHPACSTAPTVLEERTEPPAPAPTSTKLPEVLPRKNRSRA